MMFVVRLFCNPKIPYDFIHIVVCTQQRYKQTLRRLLFGFGVEPIGRLAGWPAS